MPNIAWNSRSGERDVDSLLEDARWATNSLTFSFPTLASQYTGYTRGEEPYNNFQAFSAGQQVRVRQVIDEISSVAMLNLREVSGGAGDLRYGMTDDTDAAHAYTPTTGAWGGDSWYNNSSRWYDSPRPGNYAYHALLHETGHALGLKHPHETHQFGSMSAARDWMAYTVMSYRSHQGGSIDGGYANEDNGFAQSLMMYDIAALQHMYGARFDVTPVDTVYRWTPEGQIFVNDTAGSPAAANRIFRTVWDGGGNDTYDLSAYSNSLTVNLEPGQWSTFSAAQLPSLSGPSRPPGNVANALLYKGDSRSLIENAIGGSADDSIRGNHADNRIDGGPGADRLSGGKGNDVYVIDNVRDLIVDESPLASSGGRDLVIASVSFSLGGSYADDLTLTGGSPLRAAGNGLANVIRGNGAANVIDGGGGSDLLIGGGGNDRYGILYYGDVVQEQAGGGTDTIIAGSNFRLSAEVENLNLTAGATLGIGNGLDNWIVGNALANRLDGGAGADFLLGGGGDDIYVVDSLQDRVIEREGLGSDMVQSRVGYVLPLHVEALQLLGSVFLAGTGNALDNEIKGNGGTNRLNGALGDDWLYGGRGNDVLIGGEGNDRFCFDTGLNRFINVDDVLDFTRVDDAIFLDCSVFTAIGEGRLDPSAFHGGAVADDSADRILFDQGTGRLLYDADGNGAGAAVVFATLQSGATVNQFDFFGY